MSKKLLKQLERALELIKQTGIDDLFDLAWPHTDPQHIGIIYYDPTSDSLRGASRKEGGEIVPSQGIADIPLLSIPLHEDAPPTDKAFYHEYLTEDNYWKDEAIDAIEDYIIDLREELEG